METRNNNREAEKELARMHDRQNQRNSRILILAAALSVFMLYAVFSIASGKQRADYLIDIRGMGTLATVSLENGSAAQYEAMKNLPYIKEVGIKKTAASARFGDTWNGTLVFADQTAYEKLLRPAYTDVEGAYPQKADELLLSTRNLGQMGIDDPKLGQKISLEAENEDGEIKTFVFSLSGFYTEYTDAAVSMPEGYISEAFLTQIGASKFPADKILAAQAAAEGGEKVETRLYSDLTMEYDAQQVFGENPMVMQSVEGTFGSLAVAAGCGISIVLCAFLLIYNITSISIEKEIQQYGLLKIIGTTGSQLRRIALRGAARIAAMGIAAGGMAGIVTVKCFLHILLQKLFMHGFGKSDGEEISLLYLSAAAILTAAVVAAATTLAIRKVIRWNPVESVKYVDAYPAGGSTKKRANRMTVFSLACRNVTRSKRRLLITTASLVLASTLALCAAVLMRGTDLTNQLEENPDFQLGILAGIFRHPEKAPGEINDTTPVLSAEAVNRIKNMDGIESQRLVETRGSYAVIDLKQDEALSPRKESLKNANTSDSQSAAAFATLQIVDEAWIRKLEDYCAKQNLSLDLEGLKNGTGCILLHHGELSQILSEKAEKAIGKPIHFYSLEAYPDGTDSDAYEKGVLQCAGYLDATKTQFPRLQTTSLGNQIHYFLLTQEAFDRLGFSEKIFDLSFDAKDSDTITVGQNLAKILQQENRRSGEMDTFYLNENELLLQTEQNRIDAANAVLGMLTVLLLLIGAVNFANTLAADHEARKQEFATLQCIGLTKRQLKRMLFLEGLLYWLILVLGILTVGSGAMLLLGKAIAAKLQYFRFVYPWELALLLAAVQLGLNVFLVRARFSK